jgi:predicted ester cyclase
MTPQTLADAYTAAWNTGRPAAVAAFFAEDGQITINGGAPWPGRTGVAAMAAGFFADVPDLRLVCDGLRVAGPHIAYLWTFSGTHSGSGAALLVSGWEEWDLDGQGRIAASRGWFDAADYARQAAGG